MPLSGSNAHAHTQFNRVVRRSIVCNNLWQKNTHKRLHKKKSCLYNLPTRSTRFRWKWSWQAIGRRKMKKIGKESESNFIDCSLLAMQTHCFAIAGCVVVYNNIRWFNDLWTMNMNGEPRHTHTYYNTLQHYVVTFNFIHQ